MRLARFYHEEYGTSYGVIVDEEIIPKPELERRLGRKLPATVEELIPTGIISELKGLTGPAYGLKLEEVKLLKPLTSPPKIICLGKNYVEHAAETGFEPPKEPIIFMKARTSLNGPYDDVIVPDDYVKEVDYEGEIAFVMARGGRRISSREAKDYVLGFMAFNDVTARDLQRRDGQWVRGKSIDGFAPIGPWIDLTANFEELGVTTLVNGERRQHAPSKDMIFTPWDIVEVLSKGMTLEPGDVIATGTPGGVGAFSNPKKLLKHGDVVEVEVWGVGSIRNRIVFESLKDSG